MNFVSTKVAIELFVVAVICSLLVLTVARWVLLAKAGYFGFLSLIPIVSTLLFTKVIFGKVSYGLLLLVPGVNIVFLLVSYYRLADVYGASMWLRLLTLFVPLVGISFIAFGCYEYNGPMVERLVLKMTKKEERKTRRHHAITVG